jgi:hypothetical protein
MKLKTAITSILLAGALASCKQEFLETAPTESTSTVDAFKTTKNAWAAVNGIHRYMYSQIYGSQSQGGQSGNMLYIDIYGEDVVFPNVSNTWLRGEYQWLSLVNPATASNLYQYGFYYSIIGNANMIIANIDNAEGSQADRDAIKAQALTYRGWAYFNLVQMFGKRYVAGQANSDLGVPLVLEPSTTPIPRNTVAEVYTQVNADLNEAIALYGSSNYTRPNKSNFNINVAKGIKSRVALTMQDWGTAAQMAKEARTGFTLMSRAQYTEGFNSYDNPEWMWGSRIIPAETNYFYSFFAYMSMNFNSTAIRATPKTIFSVLYDKISETDIRKTLFDPTGKNTVDFKLPASNYTRVPYQHKKFLVENTANSTGDIPYMRAAELYLAEAEALARSGSESQAIDVLYEVAVARDPEYKKSTNSGQALVDEILWQRRMELWGEGFRFYDLKRTGSKLDRTGGNHNATYTNGTMIVEPNDLRWQLPIPQQEINRANGIVVQNPLAN